MRFVIAALLLLLIGGCGGDSNQSGPYLYGGATTEKIDYQAASKAQQASRDNEQAQMRQELELQQLKNSAELEKARLEHNATLYQANLQQEVALSAQALSRELHQSQSEMQKWWIIAIIGALGIVLFFIYLIMRKRQEFIAKQQSEKLQHEKTLKEQEMRLQMAQKVLDTIASGKVSHDQQERLISALEPKSPESLTHP